MSDTKFESLRGLPLKSLFPGIDVLFRAIDDCRSMGMEALKQSVLGVREAAKVMVYLETVIGLVDDPVCMFLAQTAPGGPLKSPISSPAAGPALVAVRAVSPPERSL